MSGSQESKKCPVCGRGELVDVSFREGGAGAEGEPIQTAETRQVETYSCGHEVVGPRLDRTATPEGGIEAERRTSDETTEPI